MYWIETTTCILLTNLQLEEALSGTVWSSGAHYGQVLESPEESQATWTGKILVVMVMLWSITLPKVPVCSQHQPLENACISNRAFLPSLIFLH